MVLVETFNVNVIIIIIIIIITLFMCQSDLAPYNDRVLIGDTLLVPDLLVPSPAKQTNSHVMPNSQSSE